MGGPPPWGLDEELKTPYSEENVCYEILHTGNGVGSVDWI
jgi:hypothetical protein